jgi:sugar O-acyltransferase (sialic acid O-acetyltransferase NeuD family)
MTTGTREAHLVIVGAGGHARVVADVVRLAGGHTIVGYLDEMQPERRGSAWNGATILGGLDQLAALSAAGVRAAFVAVGDCAARLRLAAQLTALGFDLPTLIHPSAVRASDVAIGGGTILVAGAIVNAGARIGANVIVNTAASVDHECVLEDGVHIACGARLGGRVSVGRGSWIGLGAIVKERVGIGAGTLVGAGALVLKDVPDGVVAYGSPARVISHVQPHDALSR